MKLISPQSRPGFTLVELLIGMSLSLMIMTAVLSSYVFLGRSFTRALGITSANQPNLENQGRQTVAWFTQDVRMAMGLAGNPPTPSATSLTLVLPTSTGTTTVQYSYDSGARTLTRTPAGGSPRILHSHLLGCAFNYYDSAGNAYTSYTNYLSGIRQIALTFSAQAGSSTNQTLSQVYQGQSPRLVLRNRPFLYPHLSTYDTLPL
ncbi:MAG: prepilin-type N-terminal cleavage/methylation domain-containing protein [Opitutales bacterium]|nr:prepilin-type N-terminal cleavage/methylation domain-containing protein [Opitutales bacterium]